MRAAVNLNSLSEMIVHSDFSDDSPDTEAEDIAEAETAVQSPNQILLNGASRLNENRNASRSASKKASRNASH